eukprot:GABU01004662.1.p3 GENE.GABU01004662.1~~GABU01004662.1.p3  ORF type:complete len:261 (-),score=127.13 GABU01004662.1:40-822(-)
MNKLRVYTEYLKATDAAKLRKDDLAKEKARVELAIKHLNFHKIKMPEISKKESINVQFDLLGSRIEEARAAIEQNKEQMNTRLDEKKKENAESIVENLTALQQDVLIEVKLDDRGNLEPCINEAHEALELIKAKIDSIQRETESLEEFSKLMRPDKKEPANPQLKQMVEKFTERNKLWKNLKSYEENKKVWYLGEFLKLNVEEIEKDFKQYEADISNAETRMHLLVKEKGATDPVLNEFKTRLAFMKGGCLWWWLWATRT